MAHQVQGRIAEASVRVQLLVIFDADMVCSQEFFTKIVAELYDPQVALVLTPQVRSHTLCLSCLVLSCLVLSCLVLSCLSVLSCLVLSCLSCLVLSVLSCLVLLVFLFLSCACKRLYRCICV